MRAQDGGAGAAEVVGVVLHEGDATGQALAHDLHQAHQQRRLPVALGAEAVAVGHEPLGADAGQLSQATEVLEGVHEGHRAVRGEEGAQAQLDAGRIAQRGTPLATGTQRRHHRVGLVVLGAEALHLGVGDLVHDRHQLVDRVGVAGRAQARLHLDLVAVGVGHLAHVVAEADDPQPAGLVGARGGAHPGPDAGLHGGVLPVARDDLARQPQPRHEVGELAVPVGGLVEVHEVHVDAAVGQAGAVLRVQVQEGLLQRLQPGDPHLGRAEGVHPADDADAGVVGGGFQAGPADALGVEQRGPLHELDGDVRRGPQAGHDARRLLGDLLPCLLAVVVQAARQEQDAQAIEGHSELLP